MQSGKPVGVLRTHPGAPRVLIANALLVPRWATWDEFRRLEAEGLTMFGQMTAGSWIYIGTQGILQGTYQTFAAAGEEHFGSADLSGRTILTAGLGGMGGAQPLAATMAGAAILCVEVDPARIERRLETGYLDRSTESIDEALQLIGKPPAKGGRFRSGLLGNAAEVVPELVAAAAHVRPGHRPDRGARSARGLHPGRAHGRGGRGAALARRGRVPPPSSRVDRAACRGAARVRPSRELCFRLWQQSSRGGL